MCDNNFLLLDRKKKATRIAPTIGCCGKKVPKELFLVELPQTRTEVVAVEFHVVVHLVENIRESV